MISYAWDGSKPGAGIWFPVLVCDVCLRRIVREQDGHVAWNDAGCAFHVHKGRCDYSLMRAQGAVYTEELDEHVSHLAVNLRPASKGARKRATGGRR